MKAYVWISLAIIAVSFMVAFFAYSSMPQVMISHWDAQGNPNGVMPRMLAIFLMPVLSLVLFLMLVYLPRLDPLKANIKKFEKTFGRFILVIFLFLFYLYTLTLVANVYTFNIVVFLVPAFALLFYFVGVLVSDSKRNYFIGIRTPWTLASEKVWNKTAKFGGLLFKAAGLIGLLGLVFQRIAFILVIVPILVASLAAVVYSYLIYTKKH